MSGFILLDLKKAFDIVDPVILLKKLSDYGVQSQTVTWFRSHLKTGSNFAW